MSEQATYKSNGKLLITGEYVVLDGATALAIPTKYGQSLTVKDTNEMTLHWISKDHSGNSWFETHINLSTLSSSNNSKIAQTLCTILQTARAHNPSFLKQSKGVTVQSQLDFPRDWGLGTSSTLINNIAQWAQIDAFALLKESFGGSGYDISAGQHNSPILYSLKDKNPKVKTCKLNWNFTDHLFFVHLNQKQDSKEGIETYRGKQIQPGLIETISDLSRKTILCYNLNDFERIIDAHENKIASLLGRVTVKELLFNDFPNSVKSLGA